MGLSNGINRFRYYCSDAWDEWRHSIGVNLLALGTLATSLFVAGLVMLVLSNVERGVQTLSGDVRLDVYLADGHEEAERRLLIDELGKIEGVDHVNFVDKDEALARYRAWADDLADLVEELDGNPLPASLETYLVPGSDAAAVAAGIARNLEARPAVERVQFDREWIERLESLLRVARTGSIALAMIVLAAIIFVMASVLRLAVYARKEEIEIMRLVGATPGFIRGPFLVAGAMQGILAAVAALAAVEGLRSIALAWGGASSPLIQLVALEPLAPALGGALLLAGLAVSLTGSWFAVRPSV